MNRGLVAAGAVALLLWLLLLRPVPFEWADGNVDDGPEPDAMPWNTVVRSAVAWEHNGTRAVLGACSHGSCDLSLRTDDAPGRGGGWGALYWRAPWGSAGSEATVIPRDALDLSLQDGEDGPALVPHRVSTATYHARDPAFDLSVVAGGLLLLRLGLGGDRARPAAVAWVATVPVAPLLGPLSMTILTPLFPSALLAVLSLGVRWTWQRPRVRSATGVLLEAAGVLAVLGLAMLAYFVPAPTD